MLVRLTILLTLLFIAGCSAMAGQPDLAKLADMVDRGDGDQAEPLLLELRKANPGDAEVLAQLARVEYVRATWGRAQPMSGFPVNADRRHLDAAEAWAKQAVAANPRHANAWVVYGQIRNAQLQPRESLEMLERAEALDPSSVKLRLRKGATLRALAGHEGDRSRLQAAAREFALAIHGPIDDGNERLAAQQLSQIHAELGQYRESLDVLGRALDSAQGAERAYLLDDRAKVHQQAGEVDLALADSRAALELLEFGLARQTLANSLLLQAGRAMRDGNAEAADAFLKQAEGSGGLRPDTLPSLASRPGTFAAIYAPLIPRIKAQGGARAVSAAIAESASFIAPADIRRLHALGVDFEHLGAEPGTLLYRVIERDNLEAVRTLLDLGADTSDRDYLLNTALVGTSPQRQEIRRLVTSRLGIHEETKTRVAGMPVPGRWYRADQPFGVASEPTDKIVPAGMTLLAGNPCTSTRPAILCIAFFTRPGVFFGIVSLPRSRAGDLAALHEVPAPD